MARRIFSMLCRIDTFANHVAHHHAFAERHHHRDYGVNLRHRINMAICLRLTGEIPRICG